MIFFEHILRNCSEIISFPGNYWMIGVMHGPMVLIDELGKTKVLGEIKCGTRYMSNGEMEILGNIYDIGMENFRFKWNGDSYTYNRYDIYYKEKLLMENDCRQKRARSNCIPKSSFICFANKQRGEKSEEAVILDHFIGKNSGIIFYHKEYGIKLINPDETKNWLLCCPSADDMLFLAVHETGGVILDNPFMN